MRLSDLALLIIDIEQTIANLSRWKFEVAFSLSP
jgi:hypothetical protein